MAHSVRLYRLIVRQGILRIGTRGDGFVFAQITSLERKNQV